MTPELDCRTRAPVRPLAHTRRGPLAALALMTCPLWQGGCLNPFPDLTPQKQAPISAWIVEDCREAGPGTGPVPENEIYSAAQGRVRFTAALNETIAFQLVLSSSGAPAGPFNVSVSDFGGPAGRIDARTAISLYRVHPVPIARYRSWYPQHSGRSSAPALFADVLVPWEAPRGGGPVTVDGTRNEILWIDLAIPATAEPGDYSGRLELARPDEAPEFACDVAIRVLPIAIPGQRSLPVVCPVDPADLLQHQLRWDPTQVRGARLLPDAPNHQAAIRLLNATTELLHSHRLTPILWGSFPKYHPSGDREVHVEWEPYDRLVAGWLDGTAFPDGVPLAKWALPASDQHPNALLEGGFDSPAYARLLAAYLAECQKHFDQRGWRERALIRIAPPQALSRDSLQRIRRIAGIVRQSEVGVPMLVHAPARSLRGLGWYNAPELELTDVGIWAPPAIGYEPPAMARERTLGRQSWFMPDRPPYSGSLCIEAPPADAHLLPWQAHRYDAQGIWIENAAAFGPSPFEPDRNPTPDHDWLLYPGSQFGLVDQPLASVRLKRLRRGLQEYEMLRLLERHGKTLLSETTVRQMIRWAVTEAAVDHLLDTRRDGWSLDPSALMLARELLLSELVLEPGAHGAEHVANMARWARLMMNATLVSPAVEGVRLSLDNQALQAKAAVAVTNSTTQSVSGRWLFPNPPIGWTLATAPNTATPPGGRILAEIRFDLAGLGSNSDGIYPFQLVYDTEQLGSFSAPARLAVLACPVVDQSPRIDGSLSDWLRAPNNAAADFRLCGTRRQDAGDVPADAPTCPTRAWFCRDAERLYAGIQCSIIDGQPPVWLADNDVPVDGHMPWGQDVVELLFEPAGLSHGTAGDIFCLQVKPSGFVSSRRGCRTDPPIGPSEPWESGASVRVETTSNSWTIELAVPFSAFGPGGPGRLWGLNVTRLDARRGEYSSWSGARRHCYAPHTMGNMVLLAP